MFFIVVFDKSHVTINDYTIFLRIILNHVGFIDTFSKIPS